MRIFLHELTDIETELDFDQNEAWVKSAVERVDEAGAARKIERPMQVHFTMNKVDEVAVIQGDIDTNIRLLCSRCAKPFGLPVNTHFSSLFCKDPVMAGIAHLETQQGQLKPAGQNKGFARHAHDFEGDKLEGVGQDIDITYLSQDFIELGDVLTEQLQLQIPFQPLCEETCQGMCTQCGADLNAGRCACAKIMKQTPFAVLKNLKL
jgi:uncharacterized protein